MKLNIKEIARTAGVSLSTVSRVINGKGAHSRETVRAVEAAMEKMGFADTRRTSPPEAVGILTLPYRGFLSTSYTANLLSSMVDALNEEGFAAMIVPLSKSRLSLRNLEETVTAHGLKGLLVIEFPELYDFSTRLGELSVPTVCIGNTAGPGIAASVAGDNRQGGSDAAEYLWSLGHRRLGIISLRQDDVCQQLRREGIVDTFLARGGKRTDLWFKEYYCENDSAAAVAAELTNMTERPTAIITTFSSICRKLMIELSKNDIVIPRDLSLVSFVNHTELEDTFPAVTTISQPVNAMGEQAVRRLAGLIRRETVGESQELLPCRMQTGDSCSRI